MYLRNLVIYFAWCVEQDSRFHWSNSNWLPCLYYLNIDYIQTYFLNKTFNILCWPISNSEKRVVMSVLVQLTRFSIATVIRYNCYQFEKKIMFLMLIYIPWRRMLCSSITWSIELLFITIKASSRTVTLLAKSCSCSVLFSTGIVGSKMESTK